MEELLKSIIEIMSIPVSFVEQCEYIPEIVKISLIPCIKFVPWLFILYYIIELSERFFARHIVMFLKLARIFGPLFGAVISTVPECGYSVIGATFYSRKVITRGTLLAIFIACSDDALPLLLMDISNIVLILPIVIFKIVFAVAVGFVIDISRFFEKKLEDINLSNIDLNESACCHHKISTAERVAYWWKHPILHTFNMFMFSFISLLFLEICIQGAGSAESLASILQIDSWVSVIVVALLGMISNCVVSIFIALAFVKGIISLPALVAGLVTTTGLGLAALAKRISNDSDYTFIVIVLFLAGVLAGLLVYYGFPQVELLH